VYTAGKPAVQSNSIILTSTGRTMTPREGPRQVLGLEDAADPAVQARFGGFGNAEGNPLVKGEEVFDVDRPHQACTRFCSASSSKRAKAAGSPPTS
jgi:hypothetical protein